MGFERGRWWLAGLALVLALGGCGDDGGGQPEVAGATVPPAPATTVPADPYAVPETIDAAYLNRVFAALEAVDGEATRLIVEKKTLTPPATERLAAIYHEEEFRAQVDLWLDLIHEGDWAGFRNPPGPRVTRIERVISARANCVYAAVKRDYTAVTGSVGAGRTNYVTLRPLDPERDKFDFNPTPWAISFEGYNPDGSQPEDACVS